MFDNDSNNRWYSSESPLDGRSLRVHGNKRWVQQRISNGLTTDKHMTTWHIYMGVKFSLEIWSVSSLTAAQMRDQRRVAHCSRLTWEPKHELACIARKSLSMLLLHAIRADPAWCCRLRVWIGYCHAVDDVFKQDVLFIFIIRWCHYNTTKLPWIYKPIHWKAPQERRIIQIDGINCWLKETSYPSGRTRMPSLNY